MSSLSYRWVEPLLLASVPSYTRKHLCVAAWVGFFSFQREGPAPETLQKDRNSTVHVVTFTVRSEGKAEG